MLNFLAHGIAFLNDPYFVIGTSTPDWLSVSDRRTRIRARLIDRFLADCCHPEGQSGISPQQLSFTLGARQHLRDDDWFHRQRVFVEVSLDLAKKFRMALGPDDNFRAGFLGHIVTEMLLDRYLIETQPGVLEKYYEVIDLAEAELLPEWTAAIATQMPVRISELLPRFCSERFLFDYTEESKMLFRLNQVMRRVKLPSLPEGIVYVLRDSYEVVSCHAIALLPPHVCESIELPSQESSTN